MVIWIPMLWTATGICVFAGAHFLHARQAQGSKWLYPSFGALCLAVAAYIAVSALLQTPAENAPWSRLERLHVAISCLIFPIAVWFIALYSRLRKWRGWVLAFAVVFGILLVLDVTGAEGLLVSNLQLVAPLELPWGERINQFASTSTALAPAYYAATLAAFCWAFWRCLALWKQGERRRAQPLATYLLLQAIATGYAEYATVHSLPGPDWDALPFLVLVLLLSRALTLELHGYRAALASRNAALHEENTRRAEVETQLRDMAFHDTISRLPNRRALGEWLDARLAENHRLRGALLVVDPERFGVINYALGHRMGDLLIREIGERLSRMVEDGEYVARLDGDEFAVALITPYAGHDVTLATVLERASGMHDELAAPSRITGHTLSVSAHIGMAMFHEAAVDSDDLLRRAYAALQAAKRAGHNKPVVFAPSMQEDAERRLRIESDLRTAIENGDLYLVYQPQVDRERNLVGAETLLRWEHPVYGHVSPSEFVRIAENSGQMPLLGSFILRTAFSVLAGLPLNGRFRLAVNISPWQLFLANFLETILAAITEAGVDPRRITLEITETAFIQDIHDATAKIKALNALGIRVSIDDFGTGYASIASLKAFPVRELKIDQSFIRDMTIGQPDRFVGAMIALGRALDMEIVAEGVEREDQRSTLMSMGCDTFQGYLISKPITAEQLAHQLRPDAIAGLVP